MRDFVLSPSMAPPRSSHSSHGSNISMLFYGLAVVGIAAVVLALYNVIFVRLCTERRVRAAVARRADLLGIRAATSRRNLLSSFKYRKENDNEMGTGKEHGGGVNECVVCLSAFEEGEEVRRMPRCKHSFHADCIDMWLQSHSDCPLCRTDIHSPPLSPPFYHHRQTVVHSPENAPAVLPVSDTPV